MERAFWISFIRAISMFSIILHNWCTVFFKPNENNFLGHITKFFLSFTGSFVQLFFVISGSGLIIWYYQTTNTLWAQYLKKRLSKVILPYWITVTLFFVLINYLNKIFPEIFQRKYFLGILLKYLLFVQNQYPESWDFNRSFWFMPIIVCLYLVFPFLIYIKRKTSFVLFILFTSTISVVSIYFGEILGYKLSNLSSIFPFFIAQFSIGMVIGSIYISYRKFFYKTITILSFLLGSLLYFISFILIRFVPYGYCLNDIFTASGLFLMLIYVVQVIKKNVFLVSLVKQYSSSTYLLYLIHNFIIVYLIKQFNYNVWNISLSNYHLAILGIGYNIVLFLIVDYLKKYTTFFLKRRGI